MSTFRSCAEELFIPAERARRAGVYLAAVLAGMLGLVALEALVLFVVLVLILGEGMGSMGWPGVGGYVGLAVSGAVVVLLPVLALVWRHPGLRIDATGMSKVWSNRTQTVRWADIGDVRFNSRRSYLILVLKPGVNLGAPNDGGGPRLAPVHSLGHSLWSSRRPAHPDLIIDAVERFAPGKYTAEPLTVGKRRA
ncbi:PH domain-containing protein [Streptomyces castrisilvae]|uniref:PH domain-containing protein n=1 Tax=Streptomyces castrisilvae TaxID=3033811 RepID=A0ABY9HJF1_9ACTN|nr:PH domain-containing protein [Streptomyces sp. Mut1]WLQ34436.1 PH domain-containing protein [Streptomyces sp. Mut1]